MILQKKNLNVASYKNYIYLYGVELKMLFIMDLTKRGKSENQKRFDELLNRYPAEPEHKYPLTEDGKHDLRNMEIIDNFYDNVKYTDEEIEFMAKYDFDAFSNKFPSLCEYFMEVLD